MKTSKRSGVVAMAVVAILAGAPGAALAKGGLKGRFGGQPFKTLKLGLACTYVKGTGFFEVFGPSKPKVHIRSRTADLKFLQVGGVGADPTAPGAAFPITLAESEAFYVNVKGVRLGSDARSFPGWVAQGGEGFTLTFTGYKNGKIVGTFTGMLQPGENNPNGPIEASGSFAATCIIQ